MDCNTKLSLLLSLFLPSPLLLEPTLELTRKLAARIKLKLKPRFELELKPGLKAWLKPRLRARLRLRAWLRTSFWIRYWVLILRRNWVASLNMSFYPLLPEALLPLGLSPHPTELPTGLVGGLLGYSGFLRLGFLGLKLSFSSPKLVSLVGIKLTPNLKPGPALTPPPLLLFHLLL